MFKKMAQNIAKSTSEVIGYGVLVTDEKGMIIGCNDEKRIGEYHPPSLQVMQENRPMTTSTSDAENYGNVLPGYTLPIQFFDRVLGSVSIAGLPEEVERYGLLVQKQAEIMLREQAFLESNLLRERSLRDLIENISSYDPRVGSGELIIMQAKELGFNILKCRIAIVIEMNRWSNEAAESAFQRMLREVRTSFSNPRNVICPQENYRVTILLSASSDRDPDKIYEAAEVLSKDFLDSIGAKGILADVSVGFSAFDLQGLSRSINSARNSLRLAKQLGTKGMIRSEKFTGEALLDALPPGVREEYVTRILKGLSSRNDFNEMKETFLAWCGSPFASGNVAENLSMHRNSLQYRLKKIRSLTGKDPWNFKDAFELWAAFVISDISKN
ncbi:MULTISPECIES: CdaR family transcriptional regulator [Synergistaceae]|uniref:CdaR family transcriptional regulator n=1 Tax=Synergistaceae TaxID=649777 RepID=UPI003ADAE064|nr:helix-turn-helix domain-containing protein [Synergistaceae bacterium DZ-S4]